MKDGDKKKKLVLKPMRDHDNVTSKRKGCSFSLLNMNEFVDKSKESKVV